MILGYRLLGTVQLARLRRCSGPISDESGCDLARTIAAEFAIRRDVEFRVASACRVPLTWGVLRPVVVLPAACVTWPRERLTAALRHELAHVARLDCLTRRLAQIVCALYWPNPLVWLAARRLRTEQEQACDDLVLRAGMGASEYAEQLCVAARALTLGRSTPHNAVAMASPSTLRRRVVAILDETVDRRPVSRRAAAAGTALVACMLALSTAAQMSGAAERPATAERNVPEAGAGVSKKLVQIASRFIEMSEAAERAVGLPSARDTIAHGPDADGKARMGIWEEADFEELLASLNSTRGVDLITAPRVTTRSGQRAVIEIVREFRWATAWEPPTLPEVWVPTAFESRNTGATLEVTAVAKSDGSIALELAPQVIELLGVTFLDGAKLTPGEAAAGQRPDQMFPATSLGDEINARRRFRPFFSTRRIGVNITVRPGQVVALGRLPHAEPIAPFERQALKKPLWVFVTASLVEPSQTPAEASSGSEPQPQLKPLTRESIDEMLFGDDRAAQALHLKPSGSLSPNSTCGRRRSARRSTSSVGRCSSIDQTSAGRKSSWPRKWICPRASRWTSKTSRS